MEAMFRCGLEINEAPSQPIEVTELAFAVPSQAVTDYLGTRCDIMLSHCPSSAFLSIPANAIEGTPSRFDKLK